MEADKYKQASLLQDGERLIYDPGDGSGEVVISPMTGVLMETTVSQLLTLDPNNPSDFDDCVDQIKEYCSDEELKDVAIRLTKLASRLMQQV